MDMSDNFVEKIQKLVNQYSQTTEILRKMEILRKKELTKL